MTPELAKAMLALAHPCPDCGAGLDLVDVFQDGNDGLWYERWYCPKCRRGHVREQYEPEALT